MTAINGLSPWVLRSEPKPDTCLVTLALVYKGSHSSSNLKSLGLHLAKRPSLLRWSIQYSPMTVGGRVSLTAHLSQKAGEELKSSWVASSPSSRLRILARTSLTSGRSLSYSSNRAVWRAASEGPVEAVVSVSLASNSFHTLEGVAPSLELLIMALLPHFLSLWEILTLRPQGGCSFSGVGSQSYPSWCWKPQRLVPGPVGWSLRCLGWTPLVQTPLVRVHHPLADLRQMEPCSY